MDQDFWTGLITVVLIVFTFTSYSQIQGKVIDVNTNEPIIGAIVTIK